MKALRCLFLVSLMLMCLALTNTYGQDSLNISRVNQYYHNWSDGVDDVCIRGDYAYLACNFDGFRIVNIAEPAAPFDMGHAPCQVAQAVAVSGDFAYLGSSYDGLHIFDIFDPASPQEVAFMPMVATVNSIKIFGNYAFACLSGAPLKIIDISDPHNPRVVWNSYDYMDANDVIVRGSTAYIACLYHGLLVMDISQIDMPRLLTTYECGDGEWVTDVALSGNYAYLTCGYDGFRVIDLGLMQMVASIDSLSYGFRVKVRDDYAYVTYGDPECPLAIVDISNPLSPHTTGVYRPPQDIINFDLVGNLAYVADFQHGLRMVDIADPGNPHEEYCYSRYGEDQSVIIAGDYAYVREDFKLKIIDVSDVHSPRELGFYELNWHPSDLKVVGNIAYMTEWSPTALHVVDLSNPSTPRLLGAFVTPDNDVHQGVAVYDHYAYIAEYNGLRIIDVADPSDMQQIGFFPSSYPSYALLTYGHYLFFQDHELQFRVLDISEPASPVPVDGVYLGEYASGMKVSDGALYVVTSRHLWLFDATNLESLTLFSSVAIPDNYRANIRGVDIFDKYAYMSLNGYGLLVYDITDRTSPRCTGRYQTPGDAYGVAALGQIAVVADRTNLGFYDCSPAMTGIESQPPAAPQAFSLLPNYPNPFNASTHVQFDLPQPGHVTLMVFDLLGRSISTLADGEFAAGRHTIQWDATNLNGQPVASGRYYIHAKAGDASRSLPVMLLK